MIYDVVIIGAGPAGMSAAVYTARKSLKTLILSKNLGGQTAISWEVDNYLGFRLVNGNELSRKFKEHLDKFDCIEFKIGEMVKYIEKSNDIFIVKKLGKRRYLSKSIIIASGKEPKRLNIKGEKKFLGRGVTYCATCDGPLFAGKNVAVVGGGNSALESAIQLNKICPKIYLINNMNNFSNTADKILIHKIEDSEKIKILHNTNIKEFIGNKFLSEIKIETNNRERVLRVEGGFIEIGYIPSVNFIKNSNIDVKLNQLDEIEINKRNMTNIDGVFAAGDVTDVIEKQVVVAAGEGAKAAMQTAEWLDKQ